MDSRQRSLARGVLMPTVYPGVRWGGGGWWVIVTRSSVGIETAMTPVHGTYTSRVLISLTSSFNGDIRKLCFANGWGKGHAGGVTNMCICRVERKALLVTGPATSGVHSLRILWNSRVLLQKNQHTYDDVTTWKHFPHDRSHKRQAMRNFDVAFDISLNKLLKTIEMPVIWEAVTLARHRCHCLGMVEYFYPTFHWACMWLIIHAGI